MGAALLEPITSEHVVCTGWPLALREMAPIIYFKINFYSYYEYTHTLSLFLLPVPHPYSFFSIFNMHLIHVPDTELFIHTHTHTHTFFYQFLIPTSFQIFKCA